MIPLWLAGLAAAEAPCARFYAPADVVEAAMRVDGARRAAADVEPELRSLRTRLACVSDLLTEGDAAAVHRALAGEPPAAHPAPVPGDAADGPPHPEGGVATVDGQAYAALRAAPALVQAFDADGRVVYTAWLDSAESVAGVRGAPRSDWARGATPLPTEPSLPELPAVPLRRAEIVRLAASGALLAGSGALLLVAGAARDDWYALDPSPVSTTDELERLRVRANVTQGLGLACAGLGAAGILSVAVRVPL